MDDHEFSKAMAHARASPLLGSYIKNGLGLEGDDLKEFEFGGFDELEELVNFELWKLQHDRKIATAAPAPVPAAAPQVAVAATPAPEAKTPVPILRKPKVSFAEPVQAPAKPAKSNCASAGFVVEGTVL